MTCPLSLPKDCRGLTSAISIMGLRGTKLADGIVNATVYATAIATPVSSSLKLFDNGHLEPRDPY